MQKLPTFFCYIGGKHFIIRHLLKLIPEHTVYVEPFAGSAKLLFSKEPSKVEVINDKDKKIANLFYVVAFHFDEFYRKVSYLVYSRELYRLFRKKLEEDFEIPDVEKAVMAYYLYNTGFSGRVSFSYSKTRNKSLSFFRKIERLPEIHQRLAGVIIECKDFEDVMRSYDSEDTFFYLDPPYYGYSWYDIKFTHEEHVRLLKLLKSVKGKWMLSGYANELYDRELRDFYRFEFQVVKHSYGITQNTSQRSRPRAVEVVWCNYKPC